MFIADEGVGGTSGDSGLSGDLDVWSSGAEPSPFEELDEGAGALSADADVGSRDSDVWSSGAEPSPFEELDEGAGALSADADVGSQIVFAESVGFDAIIAFESFTNN